MPHAGPDTDRFREVVELGAVVGRLAEVVGTTVDADVAIVYDWHSAWALDAPSIPSALVRPRDAPRAYHRALRAMGVTCDVVHPGQDLDRYRVVIVPTLHLCDDAAAAAIRAAAERGAHVVITYHSGIVDEHDHVRLGGYPGAFRDLLGVRSEELFPLPVGGTVTLSDGSTASLWSERLTVADDVTVAATFTDPPLAGVPAITTRAAGAGAAWYVATALDDASLRTLLSQVVAAAGVSPTVALPDDAGEVDVTRRTGPGGSWLFVLNHGDAPITVDAAGHDLVSDRPVAGPLTVAGGGCAVVREA